MGNALPIVDIGDGFAVIDMELGAYHACVILSLRATGVYGDCILSIMSSSRSNQLDVLKTGVQDGGNTFPN